MIRSVAPEDQSRGVLELWEFFSGLVVLRWSCGLHTQMCSRMC